MFKNLSPRRAASNWKAAVGLLLLLSWCLLVLWAVVVFCFASWETWKAIF